MTIIDRKTRIYRFLIFLGFTGLGALIAWLLFDFKPPGGLIIMMGSVVGCFIGLALHPEKKEYKALSIFEMREEGRWPLARKVSAAIFLLFFCLAPVFLSPKIIENEDLRRSLFLLCGGLGLLGGTPIMFALKHNLRLLGFCSLFMSLMIVFIGLLGVFKFDFPPIGKMLLLTLGMVAPLIIILIYLRQKQLEK